MIYVKFRRHIEKHHKAKNTLFSAETSKKMTFPLRIATFLRYFQRKVTTYNIIYNRKQHWRFICRVTKKSRKEENSFSLRLKYCWLSWRQTVI
jgi:hypothetical protein